MKSLDITKKYDLSKLNDEQLQIVLDWLKENDTGWGITDLDYFKYGLHKYHLLFNNDFVWGKGLENTTNALELFEENESVYDDMLSLIEKGKQHGLKIVVTFEKL